MRRLAAALFAALIGCASPRRAVVPPPFSGQPPGPPRELGAVEAPPAVVAVETPPAVVAVEAPPPPVVAVVEAPPPEPRITVERPFRLDQRPIAHDRAVFLVELRDRMRWNKGGMGTLVGEPPPVPGHPLPKVIVDVTRAGGARPAAEVQRALRKLYWMKVVECYGLGAYRDQKLHGTTELTFHASASGKIDGGQAGKSTLPDPEVVACLASSLAKVPLPKARGGSSVALEVQIGHGDEPVAPPASLLLPGEGELDEAAVRAAVDAALPQAEACYRPALAYAPELWGRLGIRFHVTEKGKLDEAFEAETQFPDERVTLCVLRAMRGLSFPKAKGGELRFVVALRFSSDRSPVNTP